MSTLLSDPPIGERLLWRGLLRPEARNLDDRAVVASAFGALYALGGLVGLLTVVIGDSTVTDRSLMLAACGTALLIGLACLVGYRRLPRRFFHIAAAAGIGISTLAAIASAPGSVPVYAPFFGFVVMLSLLFFRPLPALLESLLALIAYAVLLYARDTAFATHLLLSSIAMIGALGVLIAVIRTRTTRVADELSVDALSDALTQLPNRRSFDQRFELELERSRRGGEPLSLVICDLDHFKHVNDEFGHDGGDAALRRTAAAIRANTRDVDLAARIGGEEFALILPGADAEQASIAAERVRHGIAEAFAEGVPSLTASCGIASAQGDAVDGPSLFAAADRALYRAKRAGRDCTAIASAEGVAIVGGGSPIGRLRQSLVTR